MSISIPISMSTYLWCSWLCPCQCEDPCPCRFLCPCSFLCSCSWVNFAMHISTYNLRCFFLIAIFSTNKLPTCGKRFTFQRLFCARKNQRITSKVTLIAKYHFSRLRTSRIRSNHSVTFRAYCISTHWTDHSNGSCFLIVTILAPLVRIAQVHTRQHCTPMIITSVLTYLVIIATDRAVITENTQLRIVTFQLELIFDWVLSNFCRCTK